MLQATQLPEPAQRPEGFRLRAWWEEQQRGFVERLPRCPVWALARGRALETLSIGGWFVSVERQSESEVDGYRELELAFNAEYHALGWAFAGGADVVVHEPVELRELLVRQAAIVLEQIGREKYPVKNRV